MLIDLAREFAAPLSAAGLLALAIWMILTGRLVPRKTHDDVIADRNHWRELAQSLDRENAKLVGTLRTTDQVLQATQAALPTQPEGDRV